jgi:uncharacterized membrane-anchored protein
MLTIILIALILILAGVLGFLMYAMWYEGNKRRQDREKRRTEAWKSVFIRTDLKA